MFGVVTLLIVVAVSLLVTRIATIALALTGLSRESARFQARSALTGTGFTTRESEAVASHPVRRRIVMLLMLVGNAGIVTAVASLLLSFSEAGGVGVGLQRALVLLGGLIVLWLAFGTPVANRWMSIVIDRALRRFTHVDVRDYAGLLHLAGGWVVGELRVGAGDWTAGRTLAQLDLPHEGVLVLGIERSDGRYVGAPKGSAVIQAGDVLVLYGRRETLAALDVRPGGVEGEREHEAARARFLEELDEQQRGEERSGAPAHPRPGRPPLKLSRGSVGRREAADRGRPAGGGGRGRDAARRQGDHPEAAG